MGTYRLFPSTAGPSARFPTVAPFLAGVYSASPRNCWFRATGGSAGPATDIAAEVRAVAGAT